MEIIDNGFIIYKIKEYDTIYKLAIQFNTSINRIVSANPNINLYNLKIGENLIIPTGDVVTANTSYNFKVLSKNLKSLKIIYPFLEVGELGKSVLNKQLYYIKIGNGRKEIFYNAAIHANEWITTPVLMKFIEDYSKAIVEDSKIYGYKAKYLFFNTSLYIAPMLNPDGVDLVTESLENVDNIYAKVKKIASNYPNIPFPSGWKANINGVDLKNFQPFCKVL